MAGLDYSAGCVNFRDVGEWLEVLAGHDRFLPHGRLLRGGKLDAVGAAADVGDPGTILNVRRGADRPIASWGCEWVHEPLPKVPSMSDYDPSHPLIRRWLRRVVGVLGLPSTRYPVLIHCTSGKDRTGMVVAAALALLNVPDDIIADEFALSDGGVKRSSIVGFLHSVGASDDYFSRGAAAALRRRLRPED